MHIKDITHAKMSDAGSARSIEAKRLQLNLKVLQRHDPSIVEILDSTSYVVLYKYVPAPVPNDMDSEDSPPGMQWVSVLRPGFCSGYLSTFDRHA